jgi:hypothetical protein
MSAQKGYLFELFRTTYTYPTQIKTHSYVQGGPLENTYYLYLYDRVTRLYRITI